MPSVRLHLKAAPAQRLLFSHLEHTLPCLRRTFSTSIRQCAAKRSKPVAKVARPAPMASKPPGSPASSSYKSFNQSLADRSDPVQLYQAASHTIYMAGCYSIGLLIFGWIAHTTSLIRSWPPVKYDSYLKVGYSVMIAMAGGMATLFIIRVLHIIPLPSACLTLVLTFYPAISHHPNHPSRTHHAQPKPKIPAPPNRKCSHVPRHQAQNSLHPRQRHQTFTTTTPRTIQSQLFRNSRSPSCGSGKASQAQTRQCLFAAIPATWVPFVQRRPGCERCDYQESLHLSAGQRV